MRAPKGHVLTVSSHFTLPKKHHAKALYRDMPRCPEGEQKPQNDPPKPSTLVPCEWERINEEPLQPLSPLASNGAREGKLPVVPVSSPASLTARASPSCSRTENLRCAYASQVGMRPLKTQQTNKPCSPNQFQISEDTSTLQAAQPCLFAEPSEEKHAKKNRPAKTQRPRVLLQQPQETAQLKDGFGKTTTLAHLPKQIHFHSWKMGSPSEVLTGNRSSSIIFVIIAPSATQKRSFGTCQGRKMPASSPSHPTKPTFAGSTRKPKSPSAHN